MNRARLGVEKEPLALDPKKREGRGRTELAITYQPCAGMIG